MGEELPSRDEVARYDSVQESRPAAETSLGRPDRPASKTAGGGAIVNVSSVAGEHPAAGFATYGTAKGALSLLTRELAQEFAPRSA